MDTAVGAKHKTPKGKPPLKISKWWRKDITNILGILLVTIEWRISKKGFLVFF